MQKLEMVYKLNDLITRYIVDIFGVGISKRMKKSDMDLTSVFDQTYEY